MNQTLALIHTSPVLVPVFDALCVEYLPGWTVFHMVDESLIRNTIRAGRLEKQTVRRLVTQIGSAFDAGATSVLVTCSSIGPGVPVARQMFDGNIFRIDEAMAEKAVSLGSRIGVLATLETTLEPTLQLVRDSASASGKDCWVSHSCCAGAFDAIRAGDGVTHDRIVRDQLIALAKDVDVVVLAQASMARAVTSLPAGLEDLPVLSSPGMAIQQVRQTMAEVSN